MDVNALPVDVVLVNPLTKLGRFTLDGQPQPGTCLELEGQPYRVLERRHQYRLQGGLYQLHTVILYVQVAEITAEQTLWEGQLVIGDISCRFNARSSLLRCAVNPHGPCDRCDHYQPQ